MRWPVATRMQVVGRTGPFLFVFSRQGRFDKEFAEDWYFWIILENLFWNFRPWLRFSFKSGLLSAHLWLIQIT